MAVIEVLALSGLPDAADPRWREWLTAAELTSCRGLARAEEHLAARLAGKLALAGEFGATPDWQEIGIGQPHHGRRRQRLPGEHRHRALASKPGPGLRRG